MEYFQEAMAYYGPEEDESPIQKCKSAATPATPVDNDDCFNCNICLDNANDPVVTLCGHLYCWPCIYKWLHFQGNSPAVDHQPQCPVCKAEVSISTLVPLYGRGQSSPKTEQEVKGPFPGLKIPARPSACGVHSLITTATSTTTSRSNHRRQPLQDPEPYYPRYYTAAAAARGPTPPVFNLGGTTTMSAIYPMVEMFGELMYARTFGNSTTSGMVGYQNSYYQSGNSSPRVRRLEMQADKSLNRISIFLFCCVVLCLLLF